MGPLLKDMPLLQKIVRASVKEETVHSDDYESRVQLKSLASSEEFNASSESDHQPNH